ADWIKQSGAALLLYGHSGAIETLGGTYREVHGSNYETWDNWDALTAAQAREALNALAGSQVPADQTRNHGLGPTGVIARDQSANWFFRTRNGTLDILQIAGQNAHPPGVKIRYKLVESQNQTNQLSASGSPKKQIGSLNWIAGGWVRNLAIATTKSEIGFPLHEIVARFAGPELTRDEWHSAKGVSGPTLAPSPFEEMSAEWQPSPPESTSVTSVETTNQFSACWFACPNEVQLQFALPDEAQAKEAVARMQTALSKALPLHFGDRIPLFHVGKYRAWLEVRGMRPPLRKLAFINTDLRTANDAPVAGRSPVESIGTNPVYSAAITIPPEATVAFAGTISINTNIIEGPNGKEVFGYATNLFSTTLTNKSGQPGLYWLTWRPGTSNSEQGFEVFIHDGRTTEELRHYVSTHPMKFAWRADWYYQSSTVAPGETMNKVLLINGGMTQPGNQPIPSGIFAVEMTLQPLLGTSASTGDLQLALSLERDGSGRIKVEFQTPGAQGRVLKTENGFEAGLTNVSLAGMTDGNYYVYFSSPGFATQWKEMTVKEGQIEPSEINVRLFR
ncbi:MAG TPA: carboxypeptidase-like regulatory domain-containing protein, partial [Verrucomicrobiae bacterium]|nr:carboxypeptidase-like regulatory domain-containing protein [Verrucomicrobiae bacterium]